MTINDTCAEALQVRDQMRKRLTSPEQHMDTDYRSIIKALQDQFISDQMTIASLRAIITELTETLQAADANARISITSSELLELIHHNEDSSDTPF